MLRRGARGLLGEAGAVEVDLRNVWARDEGEAPLWRSVARGKEVSSAGMGGAAGGGLLHEISGKGQVCPSWMPCEPFAKGVCGHEDEAALDGP